METPILGLLNPKKMQLYIIESPPFFFGMEGPTRHQKTRVLRSVFQNGPCMKWSWVFHFIRDMGSSFHRASITRTERARPPHPSSVTWIESSVSLAAKLHEHGVSVHVWPGSDRTYLHVKAHACEKLKNHWQAQDIDVCICKRCVLVQMQHSFYEELRSWSFSII